MAEDCVFEASAGPDVQKTQTASKASGYFDYWVSITDTELKEASI